MTLCYIYDEELLENSSFWEMANLSKSHFRMGVLL